MVTKIRAAAAIVIRIVPPPLFGRDCAWCVKASVEVIGCSPVGDMWTQIERAALRRYFSLGKKGCDCRRAAKTTRHTLKLTHKFAEMTPEKRPQDPSLDGFTRSALHASILARPCWPRRSSRRAGLRRRMRCSDIS